MALPFPKLSLAPEPDFRSTCCHHLLPPADKECQWVTFAPGCRDVFFFDSIYVHLGVQPENPSYPT